MRFIFGFVFPLNIVIVSIISADPTGGTASDWYYESGSRFAYTLELRDNGWSFLLPPKQIVPSGEEFWKGFKVGC